MRFLKRFLSIAGRKSKKRSTADPCVEPPVQEHLCVDDAEAAVSRLLRSSSARYSAQPQAGLSSLPPLPHPIDSVIPHPKSSSTTIASVSARRTYSVTIRSRTVHSRTEFPNAYPPMDESFTPRRSLADSVRRRSKSVPITPRDKSRLLLLRQDPSVASLMNHYDDQGHLNSTLFSNTPSPQKQGLVQRRRTGTTFRQLLGVTSSPRYRNSCAEGDISWAERFLGETDGNSSVSSLGPRTPADTHFTHSHSIDDETALSVECDTSSANHHTFSSLEVELSVSTDVPHSQAFDSQYEDSVTPQHASQIFGFLSDRKKAQDGLVSRLPQLKATTPHYRRFSAESTLSDTKHSYIPLLRRSTTHIPQPTPPANQRCCSLTSEASRSPSSSIAVFPSTQPKDDESALPQPVVSQHTGQGSRGPPGPCSPCRIPSRQSTGPVSVSCGITDISDSFLVTEKCLPMQSVLNGKSNPRPREMHSQIPKLRSASGSSSSSTGSGHDPVINSPCRHPVSLQPAVRIKSRSTEAEPRTGGTSRGKENDALSRLPQPATPVRPFGFQLHHLREAASPASSSELSPVAKDMMANLRQQRLDARQRERQAGRLGSSQSRIRY